MVNFGNKTLELLKVIYKDEALQSAESILSSLYEKWREYNHVKETKISEKDVMLIVYGDGIQGGTEKPLRTLKKFLDNNCCEEITNVHLLPICPSTSDDGFSVADYRRVDENLGDWADIEDLSKNYGIMLDAVVNHTSKSHHWFNASVEGMEAYKNYYIESDPNLDYSMITRPRTLPLLTKFVTSEGEKYYWTTFSEDQVDLNFANPKVLAEMIEVLLFYASKGAKFIRLDAIGFAYKKLGTSCMHLEETHAIVKLMRLFVEAFFPGTYIITETNVPHADNISYFGNGDEAHLVYQFPLPPLVLFSLQCGDTRKLTKWAQSLEDTPLKEGNTYFNFLASHDGVGVRPLEGILSEEEKEILFEGVVKNGGRISYKTNPDGSSSPYELNISYMNGVTNPSKGNQEKFERFMAAQGIMLSLQGLPGIYYHSLLGSENWYEGVEDSGINRRINREKLNYEKIVEELKDPSSLRYMVFTQYKALLKIRGAHSAFSPYAGQNVLNLSPSLFAVERYNSETKEKIIAIINVTDKEVELLKPIEGIELLSSNQREFISKLKPYQIAWILV
ncbi:sucrose phosphorylase [Geosporobacter subterraneus DSM 17957]|uniref:Sucrose 6(F)-phosphate phosphorylase n=1 Tax=Geosporobacter subterraneus DSM 17957 TaxID=1121919 RepID=A0A1M6MM98_9FIRM|nr:sugar phosphorylase [Geosporobacter subterraneus]SHJ84534.1 sucrose phosphorylase [Geosporobacter subterraneus DSM 17957]